MHDTDQWFRGIFNPWLSMWCPFVSYSARFRHFFSTLLYQLFYWVVFLFCQTERLSFFLEDRISHMLSLKHRKHGELWTGWWLTFRKEITLVPFDSKSKLTTTRIVWPRSALLEFPSWANRWVLVLCSVSLSLERRGGLSKFFTFFAAIMKN